LSVEAEHGMWDIVSENKMNQLLMLVEVLASSEKLEKK
jgi:hypothetical protein